MNILVTGGAGYIGSHTVRALTETKDFVPVVFDNLSTGHAESIPQGVHFVQGDIHDVDLVAKTLKDYQIDGVIHFAAYSLVGESMVDPAKYYANNVEGTLHLLQGMRKAGVDKIVFSSTAAVYGEPEKTPIEEDFPHNPTNVYGRTKLVIENMMRDFTNAYGLHYVALRYFNAAGAALDGTIGEDHNPETHLIPLILKTAQGVRDHISIFGTDYPTPDGTCLRDYIHVLDLAQAHILAMKYLLNGGEGNYFNLGSEKGFSVREIIDMAKKVTGTDFKVVEEGRRAGDPAILIASSKKCKETLGWKPVHSSTEEIIGSAWKWHVAHPHGYSKK
jgi:UDP-glucose 4-epimerase